MRNELCVKTLRSAGKTWHRVFIAEYIGLGNAGSEMLVMRREMRM